MGAFRIFSRFAELLDINVTRAAAAWLRLNTDGTVTERTAAQTVSDLGAATLTGNQELTGTNLFHFARIKSGTYYAQFDGFDETLTANRVYVPPNATGTLALTDQADGKVNLSSFVTGTLPIANGGTGSSNAAGIWTNAGGTGTIGSPVFSGAINANGGILFPDDTVSIGLFGANRPRALYVARDICCGNDWSIGSTTRGFIRFPSDGVFSLVPNSGTASIRINFTTSGTVTLRNGSGTAGTGNLDIGGTLTVSGASTLAGGYLLGELTVATLPTASTNTRRRYEVTDSLTPTVGSTVAAGGSAKCTVRSNGTNWVVTELH